MTVTHQIVLTYSINYQCNHVMSLIFLTISREPIYNQAYKECSVSTFKLLQRLNVHCRKQHECVPSRTSEHVVAWYYRQTRAYIKNTTVVLCFPQSYQNTQKLQQLQCCLFLQFYP